MPFVPDKSTGFVPDQPAAPAQPKKKSISEYDRRTPGIKEFSQRMEHLPYEAGGEMTDIAAGAGLPPQVAGGLGYLTNVGLQAVPMMLGGEFAKGASPAIQSGARQLMQSALKPGKKALETGKGAEAVQTLLDKGVNVTPGGVQKLRGMIDEINTHIKDAISKSTANVDKNTVSKALDSAAQKFKMQVTPQSDLASIEKARQEFLNHPMLTGKQKIPVQTAQEIKTGTYRAIGSKNYGELKGAETEAQKQLARGLKEEIAKAVPGIDKLNKEEGKLLDAESLTTARVLMDANKNPMGLGWLAAHPKTWLGFAADRSPFIKSLLARGLYSGSEAIPQAAGQAAGAAVGSAMGVSPKTMHNLGVMSPVPIPQKEPTAQEIDQNWAKYMQPIVEDQKKMKEYQKQQQEKQQHQFDWMQGVRG